MARILLIDDEEGLRSLLRRALEQRGHVVVEARDGREGLRLHRQDPAEVVITDIQMPDRDGLEVIMDLRREARGAKVIAMSGGGSVLSPVVALEMALPLGAFATLTKPFRLEELFDAVDRALAA